MRRWAGAVIVLALAATAALTAATAARRTDTAYRRALNASHIADAYVSIDAGAVGPSAVGAFAALDRSSLVVDHAHLGGATVATVRDGAIDDRFNTNTATAYLPYDDRVNVTISKFRVLAGRVAAPTRAAEVTVNETFAREMHLGVGDRVDGARVWNRADYDDEGTPDPRKGTPVNLRIVGVVQAADDVLSPQSLRLYTTPAFTHRFPTASFYFQDLVVLRHGAADLAELSAAVDRIQARVPDAPMFVSPVRTGLVKVERAADPLVNGLWILAVLAFAVGVLLAGQACARVITSRAEDHAILRAIGLTPGERLRADLASAFGALAVAALLAVGAAWLLSPITVVGAARGAEPHPGHVANLGLDLVAIAAIVLTGMLAVLPGALRQARSSALPGQSPAFGRPRPSAAARAAANARLGTPAVVGAQLAFEPGRGATALPVVSVLASLVLIITTVTATVAFGVNLDRLVGTKRLYGWNWDVAVGDSFAVITPDPKDPAFRAPGVDGLGGIATGRITIAGVVVPGVGLDRLRGAIEPTLVSGRLPATNDEILMGRKTLHAVHAEVGDRVVARSGGRVHRLLVTGVAVMPAFGTSEFTEAGMGTGVIGAASLWRHGRGGDGNYSFILYDYGASGPSRTELATLRRLVAKDGCVAACVVTDLRPNEIDGFRGARGLPVFVGLMLLLLLVATITHALLSTLRRRRGDLAVLRALGFTRHQLGSTMRWQALLLVGAALIVGVPIGLVANRLVWQAFTGRLGVAPGTRVPIALVGAGVLATAVLAVALATLAALRAPHDAREVLART